RVHPFPQRVYADAVLDAPEDRFAIVHFEGIADCHVVNHGLVVFDDPALERDQRSDDIEGGAGGIEAIAIAGQVIDGKMALAVVKKGKTPLDARRVEKPTETSVFGNVVDRAGGEKDGEGRKGDEELTHLGKFAQR